MFSTILHAFIPPISHRMLTGSQRVGAICEFGLTC